MKKYRRQKRKNINSYREVEYGVRKDSIVTHIIYFSPAPNKIL